MTQHLQTLEEALAEAIQNKPITSVPQAIELIADEMKKVGFTKATKMKNYGYYSFPVKDASYVDKLRTLFQNDSRFKLTEKNSHVEYTITIPELDVEGVFTLKYTSTKQNSKIILDFEM